jgi:hypothetical protein
VGYSTLFSLIDYLVTKLDPEIAPHVVDRQNSIGRTNGRLAGRSAFSSECRVGHGKQ